MKEDFKQLKKQIGEKIAEKRKELEITQTELAERAGLSQAHISKIEIGNCMPRLDILIKISNALECDVCELLKDFKNEKNTNNKK